MSKNLKILVLNGPNLNLLGKREESIYGKTTLKDINDDLKKTSLKLKVDLTIHQSNEEGKLVDYIQKAENKYAGIIKSVNCTGDCILNSKNVKQSFDIYGNLCLEGDKIYSRSVLLPKNIDL